jgi:Plant transposon protein
MVYITALPEKVQGVPGMFGSLLCMHAQWKNCPMEWQGSFKGQSGFPSIVSEDTSDFHCYFWHFDNYVHRVGDCALVNMIKGCHIRFR